MSVLTRVKHVVVPSDLLALESCPLHTEKPEFAAHAPAQVEAAVLRGAHAIGFTEVHGSLAKTLAEVCAKHGYNFFYRLGDTAIAYPNNLKNVQVANGVGIDGRYACHLSFSFHGRTVHVFAYHWATNPHPATREKQNVAYIQDLQTASKGRNIAFYLADCNPSKPLRDPKGEPQATLAEAALPLIYTELADFPAGVGVTTIGRNSKDKTVEAVSAEIHPALMSDHQPVTGTYKVRRPLLSR